MFVSSPSNLTFPLDAIMLWFEATAGTSSPMAVFGNGVVVHQGAFNIFFATGRPKSTIFAMCRLGQTGRPGRQVQQVAPVAFSHFLLHKVFAPGKSTGTPTEHCDAFRWTKRYQWCPLVWCKGCLLCISFCWENGEFCRILCLSARKKSEGRPIPEVRIQPPR